jgi:hypothetical protein
MNKHLITSENGQRQIHLLAELLSYGIEWNQNLDYDGPGINPYRLGGLETTAFTFSCCVVQWFGLDSGLGASDVMQVLELDKLAYKGKSPSVEMLVKKITKFLLSINE